MALEELGDGDALTECRWQERNGLPAHVLLMLEMEREG